MLTHTHTTDCTSANTDSSLIFILTGDVGSDDNLKKISTFSQLDLVYSYLNLCKMYLYVYHKLHAVKPSNSSVSSLLGQNEVFAKMEKSRNRD